MFKKIMQDIMSRFVSKVLDLHCVALYFNYSVRNRLSRGKLSHWLVSNLIYLDSHYVSRHVTPLHGFFRELFLLAFLESLL